MDQLLKIFMKPKVNKRRMGISGVDWMKNQLVRAAQLNQGIISLSGAR